MTHRWRLLAFCAVLGGCALQTVREEPARLQVIAEPESARVFVDERFAASAQVLAVRPRALPPGTHRVTISAPGHFPHDVEVELPSGTTTIRIALRPVPP